MLSLYQSDQDSTSTVKEHSPLKLNLLWKKNLQVEKRSHLVALILFFLPPPYISLGVASKLKDDFDIKNNHLLRISCVPVNVIKPLHSLPYFISILVL